MIETKKSGDIEIPPETTNAIAADRQRIAELMSANRDIEAKKIANLLEIVTALARIALINLQKLAPNRPDEAWKIRTSVIEVGPTYELKALGKRLEFAQAIKFFTNAYKAYVDSCEGVKS